MAYKKVGGQRKYYKYAECKEGQKLVEDGRFDGIEDGTYGPQYLFTQKDGQVICLNNAGHLKYLVTKFLKEGQMCNIYYKGLGDPLTKGKFAGKEPHTFELEVDDSTTGVVTRHSEAQPPQSIEGGLAI